MNVKYTDFSLDTVVDEWLLAETLLSKQCWLLA